jgi:hypothetical protein
VAPRHAAGPHEPESRWLDKVVADANFPCETNGLVFCDTLAANYPKVIDYYLRGGKERLQADVGQRA